jgi:hypothetical protein
MLPWKWAAKTLTKSREYWIVTARPDGRPNAMIIWGLGSMVPFGSAQGARPKRHRKELPENRNPLDIQLTPF